VTKRMYAQYRRTRYIPQVPSQEIMSPIPAHGSYLRHGVDGYSDSFHGSQSVQDEHTYTKEFSVGSHQTSSLENGSWNSTSSFDLLPNTNLLASGFNVGISELDGDSNSFLNFSGSTDFALPSMNRTALPNDPFKDWDGPFSTRPLPPDLDACLTSNQASATKSAGSDGWSDDNVWDNGLLLPGHGPFLLEYRGYNFPLCFNQ
jgi:hypothetical protein